jgi:hypothetical protein
LETREGKTEGRRVEKEVEVERVPLMEMGISAMDFGTRIYDLSGLAL